MNLSTILTTWAIQLQPIFAQDGSEQAASEATVRIPSKFSPVTPEGQSGIEAGGGADADLAEKAGDIVSQFVHDTIFKPIYDAMAEFTSTILETISSYWMNLSIAPIFKPGEYNDLGVREASPYDQLFTANNQDALLHLAYAILMISLIWAGIRIMWTQRPDGFKDVLNGLLLLVIVATGGRAIMFLLTSMSDSLASTLIKDAFDGKELAKAFLWIFGFAPDPKGGATLVNPTLPFGFLGGTLLMVFMILASLAQFFTMVGRTVFLVTVFFFLEPIAAGAMSPTGIQRFQKTMGWIMAALLYKPAVAMLFWVAAKLANAGVQTGGTNSALLISIGIMLFSTFMTFPLVALCVPWIGNLGAASGGSGSAMASIGSAVTGAVAPKAISAAGQVFKTAGGASWRAVERAAKWVKGSSTDQSNPSGADPNASGSGPSGSGPGASGLDSGPGSGGSGTQVVKTKAVTTGKQTVEVTKTATTGGKVAAMPVATGGTARVAAGAGAGPVGVGVVALTSVASGTMNSVKSQTVRELNTMLPGGASAPASSSPSYQVPSGPPPRFDTGSRGAQSTPVKGPEATVYQRPTPGVGPRKLY